MVLEKFPGMFVVVVALGIADDAAAARFSAIVDHYFQHYRSQRPDQRFPAAASLFDL